MNNILIFSDLEGTILREKDGLYDQSEMFEFLQQISRLEELLNAKARIHIVSPISEKQMKLLLNKLDRDIMQFNQERQKRLNRIEAATASVIQDDFFEGRTTHDNRILLLQYDYEKLNPNLYGNLYGKEKCDFVQTYLQVYDPASIKKCIYTGNGRNDILTMRKIQEIGGIVICPSNSRTEIRSFANYKSDKEDLEGLIDGYSQLCRDISLSQPTRKEEDLDR